MNKEVKRYIQDIRYFFPTLYGDERKYFKKIEETVIREMNDYPESDIYNECINRFGSPQEILLSYYDELEEDQLLNRVKKQFYVRRIFYFVILAILITSLITSVLLYRSYLDAKRNNIYSEEITIETIE